MAREIDVVVTVSIPDDVDPHTAGESLFNTLAEYADEDLVESIDDWKLRL
jgi:hypothetical protein